MTEDYKYLCVLCDKHSVTKNVNKESHLYACKLVEPVWNDSPRTTWYHGEFLAFPVVTRNKKEAQAWAKDLRKKRQQEALPESYVHLVSMTHKRFASYEKSRIEHNKRSQTLVLRMAFDTLRSMNPFGSFDDGR